MFTSSAVVFRTRQAVRDLAETVGVHREAVQRLGVTGADRDAISRITANGCRIETTDQRDAYSSFLLAAAMPEEDFGAFIGATAVLLADRLQGGAGTDNLFWNWDAFRDHYRLADPTVRAALMNGFRLAADLKIVTLTHPPSDSDCLTFGEGDVVVTLQSVGLHEIGTAVRTNVTAEEAGELWLRTQSVTQNWQMRAGFRYLYERPASISPPDPNGAPLISWV